MNDPAYFRTFARYNRWANTRLYDAALALPDEEYRREGRAFFGSIHATLNHLLAGDRIWMGRIEGMDHGIARLDQILFDDAAALRAAREEEDRRIIAWTDALRPEDPDRVLEYRTFAGDESRTPLGLVLGHMFNHQTHHRGQAHAMLTMAGAAPPGLDLIYYLREA